MAVPDFKDTRIIVVGDVMLDRYWSGQAARISPEAPVPVVRVKSIEDRIGGAGNVALNIAKLGGKVTLLGVIGSDEEGGILRDLLEQENVGCDFIISSQTRTICKLRILAQHQQLIRLDFEETPLNFDKQQMLERLNQYLPENDVVVFSDYAKGTLASVADYIGLCKQANVKILVDPKGVNYASYAQADVITPNISELQAVVGECADDKEIIERGQTLIALHHIHALLLTRGEVGVTLIQEHTAHSLPAQAKDVFDVTGAGDTVIAVLALGLAANMTLAESVYLANLAGGIVVGKLGTSTVSMLELIRAMYGEKEPEYGVVKEDDLVQVFAKAKTNGERIIMTNGCFDILHVGHLAYLEQAKALGDRLVVAVNTDASVKRLKGDSRPINALHDRMAMLAALACVDWVVAFDEDTPDRLYSRLLPDVIVKGGDYKPEQVAGGQSVINAGGEVKILQFVEGQSTTSIINKAKGLA
ncbi:MAG: bifunctional D-glycero-beta-D-manno-heptose-7-phosphate kinase/D-glycero-beta-D-manno-heptose 1-phosphate adenylyltransferase HldE [Methylococcaceae bacterium]